ncbi:phenylacetic acid degradation bifunctional protein PaaZ [Cribrihabitans neustonicus]|uniref:phenylacetic acid degradation bifunctional protein PaaZ n=1 Tax=Cribrihabitans neustonicus TaxID=1429085 RepID=UPI003B5A948E
MLIMQAMEPRILKSFVGGVWQAGTTQQEVLLHAALGHPHAVLAGAADDIAEAVVWARQSGGPALRRQSFHARARMVKALAKYLDEHAARLSGDSLAAGATGRDGKLDIQGGIRTMQAVASAAVPALPDQTVLQRGQRGGPVQRILTPRPGVAVQITCYDTPVRDALDRITPALIAGMPCILRPARETAFLAEALVRLIEQSQLLPPGALQLVHASAEEVLEQLGRGDTVAFSGPREMERRLRSHPAVVSGRVAFRACTSGLSAAILGADALPGSAAQGLFLRGVVEEITVNAGQRRGAVRRILVPRGLEEQVTAALAAELRALPVGLPDDPSSRMGALVSLRRREEARSRLAALSAECEAAAGTLEDVRLHSGDAERGAFLNPVLLRCRDPQQAEAVHRVCVRGPAATVIAYDSLCDAFALAARAPCSLGAVMYSDDAAAAREAAVCLAAAGGTVRIRGGALSGSGQDAGLLLAPGTPGAPGAAPDLDTLLDPYLTATDLDGPPQLVSALTGQWIEGAPAQEGTHPFRKPLSELCPGDCFVTPAREITQDDVEQFAHLTGDRFYAHMDEEAARLHPFFGRRVAHGQLVVAFANGLYVDPDPGPVLANIGTDNLRFHAPVYFGDRLHVRLTCKRISPASAAGHGEVCWDCRVLNGAGRCVASFDLLTLVAAEWPHQRAVEPLPETKKTDQKDLVS